MSIDPLHNTTLDRVYNVVIEHLKSSGEFDEMRVNMVDKISSDPDFSNIVTTFLRECDSFCKKIDLDKPRKDLRLSLDRHFDSASESSKMARECIKKALKQRQIDIREKFITLVIEYLKNRFMQHTPPDISPLKANEQEAKIEETTKVETIATEVPIDSEIRTEQLTNDIQCQAKSEQTTPQLEDTEMDMEIASLNSPVAPEFSPISLVAFSDVSSVHTADLSDFEDSIKLSDDEANIVGQPKNSRIKIEELQGTINGLETKMPETILTCNKQESSTTTQTCSNLIKQETHEQQSQEPSETGESDACSESTTNSRISARKRKSNPRYSNEHFTL